MSPRPSHRQLVALGLLLALATPASILACSTVGSAVTNDGTEGGSCATGTSASKCIASRFPRLAVAFGDSGAAALSYAYVVDGQTLRLQLAECTGHEASSAYHCDVGFSSYPAQDVHGRLEVGRADGGAPLLSVDIALRPFNYCGNGIAQIVLTTGDGGMPSASPVTYVDACTL